MKNIKNYYTIEKRAKTRTLYIFKETNKKGEEIAVEISNCTNPGGRNSIPSLWYKKGYTNKIYETYLCVDVYVTDKEGNCRGRYNPTHKLSEDKKRYVINFDWLLEDTEENKEKLLYKIYELAFTEV